jgi:hypothetical protein
MLDPIQWKTEGPTMKKDNNKRAIIILACLLVVIGAVAIRMMFSPGKVKPPPSAPGYYTGPMKNKSGTLITNEDGTVIRSIPKDQQSGGAAAREGGN